MQTFEFDAPQDGPYKGPVHTATQEIRSGFIRKVYGILCTQLAMTFVIAAPFSLYVSKSFVQSHMGLYYLSLFASTATLIGMFCCCQQAAKTYPTNYIMLFTFTLFEAILIGFVVSLYTVQSVVLAVLATAVTFAGLTFYACTTKSDFTGMGSYLIAGLMGLCSFMFVVSMCSWFMPIPPMVQRIYGLCGVLMFSFYIIYDTQLIVGGSHKQHQFDIDDYVFAALNLYLDIINLFLYLLSLLGERN